MWEYNGKIGGPNQTSNEWNFLITKLCIYIYIKIYLSISPDLQNFKARPSKIFKRVHPMKESNATHTKKSVPWTWLYLAPFDFLLVTGQQMLYYICHSELTHSLVLLIPAQWIKRNTQKLTFEDSTRQQRHDQEQLSQLWRRYEKGPFSNRFLRSGGLKNDTCSTMSPLPRGIDRKYGSHHRTRQLEFGGCHVTHTTHYVGPSVRHNFSKTEYYLYCKIIKNKYIMHDSLHWT